MASTDDEIAKSNFSGILSDLKRPFEITDSKWIQNQMYEIKFRTQIVVKNDQYNKCCDKWVDEFSYITDTIWVHKISNTGPKVKFRKQYQCWPYETKEVDKDQLFDPYRCRATLDIKVLGDTSAVKRTNRFLRLGLNALVKVNFQHLHIVDTSQNYSFFVHWCKSLPEAPPPTSVPTDIVNELVAKIVENAPLAVQKASERAKEALKKQCNPTSDLIPVIRRAASENIVASKQTTENSSFLLPINSPTNSRLPIEKAEDSSQLLVNPASQQCNENIFYIHQVVFDSATQTLRDVVPTTTVDTQNIQAHQLVEVQLQDSTSMIRVQPMQVVEKAAKPQTNCLNRLKETGLFRAKKDFLDRPKTITPEEEKEIISKTFHVKNGEVRENAHP